MNLYLQVIIDNIEEDADMRAIIERVKAAVATAMPNHEVDVEAD